MAHDANNTNRRVFDYASYLDSSCESIPELPTPHEPFEQDDDQHSISGSHDSGSPHDSISSSHDFVSPIEDVTIMSGAVDDDDELFADDHIPSDDDLVHSIRNHDHDYGNDNHDHDQPSSSSSSSSNDNDNDDDLDNVDAYYPSPSPTPASTPIDTSIGRLDLSFSVNRATISRTALIPCCVFVGRIRWHNVDWEIHFGQKQLLRLHVSMLVYMTWQHRRVPPVLSLPWTLWREKRAQFRVEDAAAVDHYIQQLLSDDDLRNADPLLSFLEVSPSRAMSRYGPSLKEGYVHMRMNGAFQLPVYSCINRTIEALYRHLYRAWMRIAFISVVVTLILPIFMIILTTLPQMFAPKNKIVIADGETKMVREGISTDDILLRLIVIGMLIFAAVFVYRFFNHRLGVIRRWVVLKPNCFAAYRRRFDTEPSEVFLFDKKFAARKGSYRQGVSWMPSGFVVGSRAGFIEIDTGHYNTRFTMGCTLILACYGIIVMSSRIYDAAPLPFPTNGLSMANLPSSSMAAWSNRSKEYCGFSFTAPTTIHIVSSNREVGISRLREANSSYVLGMSDLLGSESVSNNFGILASTISQGTVISVVKPIDPINDRFVPSGYATNVSDVGTVTLSGLELNTTSLSSVDYLCVIPINLAAFRWSIMGYYLLLLLAGGVFSATAGLALNYLITYTGLWHSHVRRDHWYRSVKRLQKFKRQETEYRYHSFAPDHSSLPVPIECGFDVNDETPLPENVSPKTETSEASARSEPSFVAPPPPPCRLSWHVDGEDTYEAIFNAIKSAKYEILIAGWWITPDLYLLRPNRKLENYSTPENAIDKQNESQLRKLLLRKAKEGIKIYVLIYREVKLALTLNSAYTKRSLMLHPNIRVLRDPIFQIQSLGFWSHHEKIVCIDQSMAFAGGLDMCFGRYDHSGHPLSDIPGSKIENQTWPGKDFSNPIIKDFVHVSKPYEDLIDRESQPRMPWHDVHSSISGPAVQDIAFHFIQRWNFVCSKNDYQLRTGWCICMRSRKFKALPKCLLPMDFNGWRLRYPESDDNKRVRASASQSQYQRGASMEIDCHGLGLQTPLPYMVNATDISIPASISEQQVSIQHSLADREPDENSRVERVPSAPQLSHPSAISCNLQVCRSASMWSAGVPTEASIHEAYLDLIAKSQHYVYIENQFFVSGLDNNGVIHNRILQALVDRITRAVRNHEVFRVFVVMPLLPAFEGNIHSEELTNLHAIMHWQYMTISRGQYSLMSALAKVTEQPHKYVSFFGLRKYGILPNGCVATEQIYIHSKLMIVDDRLAIIGSANINDRSLNGDRDSEIALVVEDVEFADGMMNETPYRRGVLCGQLRMQLMREHMGLAADESSTRDPVSEKSWQRIKTLSGTNTRIFETVFNCAPSNNMRSFTSLNQCDLNEIFENQRMNVLKRPGRGQHMWDQENLKPDDYAPWTDVNGVPITIEKVNMDDYVLDRHRDKSRRHFFSIDHEGWCYARNFLIFQEIRMTRDVRNRDKLKHFMADRLMAQVRRRRYVKKDSEAYATLPSESFDNNDDSDDDEQEHWNIQSILKRFRSSDAAESPNTPEAAFLGSRRRFGISFSSAFFGGGSSYPNSPVASSFHQGPTTEPPEEYHRAVSVGDAPLRRSSDDTLVLHDRRHQHHDHHERKSGSSRHSLDSFRGSLAAHVKKWTSFMDEPLENTRRSKFLDEYFPKDGQERGDERAHDELDEVDERDESNSEGDRPSSCDDLENGGDGTSDRMVEMGTRNGQINQLKTVATVKKEDETRARGQLSEIRGHLVDFPLDFLAEEFLKPSIMPRDIHI